MMDIPINGAFCYEDSITIDRLQARIEELEREQAAWRKFTDEANKTLDKAEQRIEELGTANKELEAKLAKLRILVAEQETSVGLWFNNKYATEAYSRFALRRLHKVIEEMKP